MKEAERMEKLSSIKELLKQVLVVQKEEEYLMSEMEWLKNIIR